MERNFINDNGRLSEVNTTNSWTKTFLENQLAAIQAQKAQQIAERDAEIADVQFLLDQCNELYIIE